MPPHIHNTKIARDKWIILSKGLKLENQHTRMTLGTLSWVYKPSNYLMVIGSRLSLLVVQVARPTASSNHAVLRRTFLRQDMIRLMITLDRQFSLQTQ